MFKYFCLIITVLFSLDAYCQLPTDLINKTTKQWLIFTSSSALVGKPRINKYHLVSKNDKCEKVELTLENEKTKSYCDSLVKIGWTPNIKYKTKKSQFIPSITLESILFDKMTFTNDSIFKFVYKISLTDVKKKSEVFQLDTLFGTQKQQVIQSIANRDYTFEPVRIQRGTNIIIIRINSPSLFETFKKEEHGLPPGNSRQYLF